MFERTIITKLDDHIYLLDDHHEATGYLVLGQERAALIDTMNGVEDLREVVRSLTDLPLVIINTHGHPDHIFGNIFFDEAAYMSPLDLPLAEQFIHDPQFASHCAQLGRSMPPFLPLTDGDVIDLGGRKLEAILLPGHTPGGMLLLDHTDGTLYTGDSINWHTWMQLDCCLPMHEFLAKLNALEPRWQEVQRVLHGHALGFDDASLLRAHRDAVADLIAGNTADDEDYTYFAGTVKAHPYPYMGSFMHIIYDPARPL